MQIMKNARELICLITLFYISQHFIRFFLHLSIQTQKKRPIGRGDNMPTRRSALTSSATNFFLFF